MTADVSERPTATATRADKAQYGVAALLLVALSVPTLGRWLGAGQSVSGERLRTAEVHRGTLVRDVSVQGRMVAAAVAGLALDRPLQVQSFGLTEFPACGQNDEVLRAHGLDAESLAAAMAQTLTGKAAA